jgi:hypothetical protein
MWTCISIKLFYTVHYTFEPMLGVTGAFAIYWLLTTRSSCVGRHHVADEKRRILPSRFLSVHSKESAAASLPGTMLTYSAIKIQHQRATITLRTCSSTYYLHGMSC